MKKKKIHKLVKKKKNSQTSEKKWQTSEKNSQTSEKKVTK